MKKLLIPVVMVILFVSVAAVASAQTLRVTADRTNLRDKPTTDGAIVGALTMGTELEVIDQSGMWYHVRVKSSGTVGYVSTLGVPGTVPASAPPAAPTPRPPAAQPAAQAPASTAGGDEGYGLGYTDVGAVIGVGGLSGAGVGFGGRFEKAFKELPNLGNGVLGLGVSADFFSFGTTFFTSGYDYRVIPIAVTVNYHLRLENRKIDPFFGAGLGYEHFSVTGPSCVFAGVDYCSNAGYSSGIYFVGHGGIRYFWQPKIALYADVGSGTGALHVGVMFKIMDGR